MHSTTRERDQCHHRNRSWDEDHHSFSAALAISGNGVVRRSYLPPPSQRKVVSTKGTIAQYGDVFLYAPLYIAKDAGFFSNRGLDVSIVSTGGDDKTWAAVTSGSAAFGVADPTFVAISDARGQPGRVVASIVNGIPFWGVTFKPDIGAIEQPKDLDHYSVATFPSPSTAYTLQSQMFVKGGLAPRIREGAVGTLLPMIRNGQADIALELEPNVSSAVKDGAHVVYSMNDVYGAFAMTGLTATPAFLDGHSDIARDIVCSPLPIFAFAPLMIVWFGIGWGMKVALAAFSTVFVAFDQAYRGANLTSRDQIEVLTAMRASSTQIFTKAVIPGAIDWVLSSMRLNVGFGLLGAFIGEFIAADRGLGYLILRASGLYNIPRALAAAFGITILAFTLNGLAWYVELHRRTLVQLISVPRLLWK